jgi:Ca-activated chloride channel family protein
MNVLTKSAEFVQRARLVEANASLLPLVGCNLEVDACGGYARVRLRQRFENPHAEALTVLYKLPLPADAAVSDFSFRIGERLVRGKVKGRAEARREYEHALVEGRSAALLEQERSNLFSQEIANIPPRSTVEIELDIGQPLAWLTEGFWEWRFPLTTAPRYLGGRLSAEQEGRLAFAIAQTDIGVRASLALNVRDLATQARSPESPSHPLSCTRTSFGHSVELGAGNAAQLDRDIVVRWCAAASEPGLSLDVARPSGAIGESLFGLLTLVPPSPDQRPTPLPRDLTLLLDTSGSMSGEPLDQLKRIACALVDSLADTDLLEMVEFSSRPSSFRQLPEPASPRLKAEAIAWIQRLQANGGTEMVSGVEHAMKELRPGSQRQIILITDGLVGFEEDIVQAVLARLPLTARLHCVGVGSAVNRSLVAPIARAGRGVEAIVGLGEDGARAAARVLSHTVRPMLVDVVLEGDALRRVAPSRLPDVYAGCPLRAALELAPEGGRIRLRARMNGAAFIRDIEVAPVEQGRGSGAIAKLFARELVEDLEMQLSSGGHRKTVEGEIERAGIAFQIATRLSSWIAVTEERSVDPRDPSRRVEQPNALAYGLSAEGLGLRAATHTGTIEVAAEADGFEDDQNVSYAAQARLNMPITHAMQPQSMASFASMAPPSQAPSAYGAAPPPPGFPSDAPAPAPAPPAPSRPVPQAPSAPSRAMPQGPPAGRAYRSPADAPPPPPPLPARKQVARDEEKAKKAERPTAQVVQPAALITNGRLVFISGNALTVEFALDLSQAGTALSYQEVRAILYLRSGVELELRLWPEHSAREGALAVNLQYRLTFVADRQLSAQDLLGIRVAFANILVEIR